MTALELRKWKRSHTGEKHEARLGLGGHAPPTYSPAHQRRNPGRPGVGGALCMHEDRKNSRGRHAREMGSTQAKACGEECRKVKLVHRVTTFK